jgi:hypothetical protein
MHGELRAMLEPGTDLMKDLREMRAADAEDEALFTYSP